MIYYLIVTSALSCLLENDRFPASMLLPKWVCCATAWNHDGDCVIGFTCVAVINGDLLINSDSVLKLGFCYLPILLILSWPSSLVTNERGRVFLCVCVCDQDSEKPFWGRSNEGILRQKRAMLFWDGENEACVKRTEWRHFEAEWSPLRQTIFNPFTATMSLWKRPLKVQNLKPLSLFVFFFRAGMWKDFHRNARHWK